MLNSEIPNSGTFTPNEKVTGALVFFIIAITTWALGGTATWVPPVYISLSILAAIFSVVISLREGQSINVRAFVPFLLFSGMVSVSLLNPSYEELYLSTGILVPRKEWLPWLPSVIARSVTLNEMLPWLSAFLLGAALRQANLGAGAVRLLWGALLVHTLILSAVGLVFHLADPLKILGRYHDIYGYHFASFIYRNHWAAYVIILVSLALGFAFSALRRWLKTRGRFDAVIPGIVAALLLALTLPIPGSRSGMLIIMALLLGAVLKMGLMIWRTRSRQVITGFHRLGVISLAIFACAIIGLGSYFNREMIQRHWDRSISQIHNLAKGQDELRMNLSRDTIRIAMDRPILGWGVGSFRYIFPKYQGDYLRDTQGKPTSVVHHAHNDWAEMWAETGLLGLLILITPVVIRVRDIWRSPSVLSRWGGGAVLLILAYALVDFPLQNPAVLFLWVTVLSTAGPRQDAIRDSRN